MRDYESRSSSRHATRGNQTSPVILALKQSSEFQCRVYSTGQHKEMLSQVLKVFRIQPDVDLDLMVASQTLGELTGRTIRSLDALLTVEKPAAVLVQGDTTTSFCAALTAFYHKIPVGHVEAGLRTGDLYSPWPEEANRLLTTRLARWHFAATEKNRENLLREGISQRSINVTGNTVVDALLMAVDLVRNKAPRIAGLHPDLQPGVPGPRIVLITGHRRENFDHGLERICLAVADLAHDFPEVHFVYPVHLNPNVQEIVRRILGARASRATDGGDLSPRNVHLIPPLDYLEFVALMDRSFLILSDSGGIQEEAPSLGKPVLVMRDTTERPEGVWAGAVKLTGTETEAIKSDTASLLTDRRAYDSMRIQTNPYGDGHASARIVDILRTSFVDQCT